jgi:hypothetical protein
MLKRMGWSRKRSVGVSERDEWLRPAWRVMVTEGIDARALVFVDECGTHSSLAPLYGWAPKGQRAHLKVARNWSTYITLLASISIKEGMELSLAVKAPPQGRCSRLTWSTF